MKVLIVEDEVFSATYLEEMLTQLGHEIIAIVDNAQTAYEYCKLHSPEVVLMDIMLNGPISGAEIAIKIRDNFPNIIIIFLTAYSDKEMIEYAVESKAFAYLLKPYRIEEIDATMQLAKAHLSTSSKNKQRSIKINEEFTFDLSTKKLYRHNQEIILSQNMQKLLEILCEHKDSFVPSRTIAAYIWGEANSLEALRALIYRFKKLTSADFIQSSIKKGYKISTKK